MPAAKTPRELERFNFSTTFEFLPGAETIGLDKIKECARPMLVMHMENNGMFVKRDDYFELYRQLCIEKRRHKDEMKKVKSAFSKLKKFGDFLVRDFNADVSQEQKDSVCNAWKIVRKGIRL